MAAHDEGAIVHKTSGFVLSVCLLATVAVAESLEDRVRDAARVTWIHGITAEIAEREIGSEGVPVLLDLLADPGFPRRDNVVAYLGYLAGDEASAKLASYLDDPRISNERPEDYRARLLVPEALGRIASRGGAAALGEVARIAGEAPAGSALAQMAEYGRELSGGPEAPHLAPEPVVGEESEPGYSSIDSSSIAELTFLTYRNHVNHNNPITNERVDDLLAEGSEFVAREDVTTDTACCVAFQRSGVGGTWGSNGDGLDVITSSFEMSQALNNNSARIKVVDSISWCSGSGSNIIGCGNTPGDGIVLVRLSSPILEGMLWIHEYGHNTGLGHNPQAAHVMSAGLAGNNVRVTASECAAYHSPHPFSGSNPINTGACHDNDGDNVVTSYDNCPDVANPSQTNSDNDEHGNSCDNCVFYDNPDQANCDGDSFGDVCDDMSGPPTEPIENIGWPLPNRLGWDPVAYEKRVFRGERGVADPWPGNETQVAVLGESQNLWGEGTLPDAGRVFYYLMNAFNGCGEGP